MEGWDGVVDGLKMRKGEGCTAKQELQSWCAAARVNPPVYATPQRGGQDHKPHFTVMVRMGERERV